jgi:hypothetical protein
MNAGGPRGLIVVAVAAWIAAPAAAQVVGGGKSQKNDAPMTHNFTNLTFGPGGLTTVTWEIDDPGPSSTFPNAPGVAGPISFNYGWDLFKTVTFNWTATPSSPLTVVLETLTAQTTVGNDVAGPMPDFDPNLRYSWEFVVWSGTYSGPSSDGSIGGSTVFDTTFFFNPHPGTFGWQLIDHGTGNGGELDLIYTPAPEPGSLALVAAGLFAVWRCRRRGQ